MDQGHNDSSAACPGGMPNGDRSAVHVGDGAKVFQKLFAASAQDLCAHQWCRRKGFVDLQELQVRQFSPDFFQGLAVMAHFFTRFAVPAIGRFLFYLFLLLQPYLLAGVAVLGIFDMWGNFRAPRQQNL